LPLSAAPAAKAKQPKHSGITIKLFVFIGLYLEKAVVKKTGMPCRPGQGSRGSAVNTTTHLWTIVVLRGHDLGEIGERSRRPAEGWRIRRAKAGGRVARRGG
jgi:hypothetical protein